MFHGGLDQTILISKLSVDISLRFQIKTNVENRVRRYKFYFLYLSVLFPLDRITKSIDSYIKTPFQRHLSI